MEGFSNWIKIERMVSSYFCSCNLEQLKVSLKKSGTRTYTHTYTHMHTCMHTLVYTYTHTHVYTNFLDKSNGKKNQVSTGQVNLAGLKMPTYTKRVNKTIKSFKRSTTRYTKADNTLYSTNSHF